MKMHSRFILIFLTFIGTSSALAEKKVVASIKPLHSLVSGVMKGVGDPALIIDGNASPHSYSLKPSQAQMLQDAQLIFWIGPDMESGLEKQIMTLGANARVLKMMDSPGLSRLTLRAGGDFEGHVHDDHADEDDHAHDDEEEHAHEEHGEDEHAHDDHDDKEEHADHDHAAEENEHDAEEHETLDTHIWLDPSNARAMVLVIAAALSESDPENAAVYASNASDLIVRLQKLEDEITGLMAPMKGNPVVVYHDAYRHFENRFDLHVVGSLSGNPEVTPGAARIVEIRNKINELGAVCVLSEPQFSSSMIATIVEDTNAKTGVIDPLGSSLANGLELYFKMLQNMARSVGNCLEN